MESLFSLWIHISLGVVGITSAFEVLDGGQNLCNSHKDKLPHFTSSVDKKGDLLLLNPIALSPVAREHGTVDRR